MTNLESMLSIAPESVVEPFSHHGFITDDLRGSSAHFNATAVINHSPKMKTMENLKSKLRQVTAIMRIFICYTYKGS